MGFLTFALFELSFLYLIKTFTPLGMGGPMESHSP